MLPQFEADPRFKVVIGTTEGETILSTNNAQKPFDDVRVRKAMAHAIDRQALIDGAMFGYGTLIGSHFAPHNPAYVDLSQVYDFDLDKAKALLKEAGLENGFKARLHLPPTDYARRSGLIIASDLKKIGIDLDIINVEWGQWLKQVFKGKDYDLTIVSHTEPMDIGIYARDDYYFQYKNPEFNAIIKELNATSDEAKRTELLHKAQKKLNDDAVKRLFVPVGQNRRLECQDQGPLGQCPRPSQRPDQGRVDGLTLTDKLQGNKAWRSSPCLFSSFALYVTLLKANVAPHDRLQPAPPCLAMSDPDRGVALCLRCDGDPAW